MAISNFGWLNKEDLNICKLYRYYLLQWRNFFKRFRSELYSVISRFILLLKQTGRRVFIVVALLCFVTSVKSDYLVVVHPSVSSKSLTTLQLKQIYVLQVKKWQTGNKIKVFSLKTDFPAYNQFVLSVLKIQPHQLTRLWTRLVFTGTGKAPVRVLTSNQMLNKVKNTEGAIGYIEKDTQLDLTGVKVLKVALK